MHYSHVRTPAQERHRHARIARRLAARGPYLRHATVRQPKAPRKPFWVRLRELRAGRDKALDFAGRVARGIAELATRTTPRCPYQHESKTKAGLIVLAAPCGGRLGRVPAEDVTYRCRTCGRDWRPIGPKSARLERVWA